MFSQVPVHRWGGEGIPLPVRVHLFNLAGSAPTCVICGMRDHGVYHCPQLGTSEGKQRWAAWDKKWLLLTGQELMRYAMCPDDAEYRRRAAALFARQVVDYNAVGSFRHECGIRQSARGYAAYQPPSRTGRMTGSSLYVAPLARTKKRGRLSRKGMRKNAVKVANVGDASADAMHIDVDPEIAGIVAVVGSSIVAPKSEEVRATNANASSRIEVANSIQSPVARVNHSPKGKAKQTTKSQQQQKEPKEKPKRNKPSDRPAVQALRTSRGTKPMTPPPSASSSSSSSSLSSLPFPPSATSPRAVQPTSSRVPATGPLLPSPKSSFRPIRVPANPGEVLAIAGPSDGRQSRGDQPSEGKSSRCLSSSAPIPTGKSGRSDEDVCVPCAELRGEVPIGSAALVVVNQSQSSSTGSRRPYEQWTVARYLVANHSGRKFFWERATEHKRSEVAFELSRLPERHEVFQEARLDFGAEKWGLCAGGAPSIDIDDDVVDDDSDHGII